MIKVILDSEEELHYHGSENLYDFGDNVLSMVAEIY